MPRMNLHRTLAAVSGMTMVSRVTGLIREFLIARAFGASSIPTPSLLHSGYPTCCAACLPKAHFRRHSCPYLLNTRRKRVMTTAKRNGRPCRYHPAVGTPAHRFSRIIGAPAVVYLMATGLKSNPDAFDDLGHDDPHHVPLHRLHVAGRPGRRHPQHLARIQGSGVHAGLAESQSSIAAALFLAPFLKQPIYALAIAVFVGGVLQLAIQVPALVKIGMLPRIR